MTGWPLRRSKIRLALALATSVALACESKFAFPDAEVGEGEDVPTVTDASDAEAPPDVPVTCAVPDPCPVEADTCREGRREHCVPVLDGCASWTVLEDCTTVGGTCAPSDTGPVCQAADPCLGLQVCSGTVGICEGTTSVTCTPNADGCKVVTRVDCALTGAACQNGECIIDKCQGKVLCPTEKVFCSGQLLQECARDDDGCLVVATLSDCAAIPGAECQSGPTARCIGETIGDYIVTIIADLGSTTPGEGALTALDRAPAIDGQRIVFRASTRPAAVPPSSTVADLVLAYDTATQALSVVASAGEPLPLEGDATFESFDAVSINGPRLDANRITFVAAGSASRRGIYQQDGDGLDALVTRASLIPGTTTAFVGLSDPHVATDLVGFNGNDFGTRSGAYRVTPGVGTLVALADSETLQPGGAGRFTGVALADLTVTEALLVGFGKAPFGASFGDIQRGVYQVALGGAPEIVADRTTPIPGRPDDTFSAFQGPRFVGAELVFVGFGSPGAQKPLGPITYKALLRLSTEGVLEPLVDTTTPMPGSTELFAEDAADGLSGAHLTVDGQVLYFRGVGTTNLAITHEGLYRLAPGGDLTRLVDRKTPIAGKTVTELRLGRQGASGGRVVFFARFSDGKEAIVLARPVALAPPLP